MSWEADQTDLDIQQILRAEIRDLRQRHNMEIALIHAFYTMKIEGPGERQPPIESQVRLLEGSSLFRRDWYQETYPKVRQSGMPAEEHYIRSGAFEGFNPSPGFDTTAYYLANPDVAKAGWAALVHYIQFGKSERRPLA